MTLFMVDEARQELGRRRTSGAFALHTLPGGHFYLQAERTALLTIVADALA